MVMSSLRHNFNKGKSEKKAFPYEPQSSAMDALGEKICINRQIDPYSEEDQWVMLDAVIHRYTEKMRR